MKYERTNPTGPAYALADVKAYARVDASDEDALIGGLASTAAAEVEHYCDMALITQTITATTGAWPGQSISLPVGPLAAEPNVTVAQIELDGTTTDISSGWWVEGGRYPRLHFIDTEPAGPLRITYAAGYGDTAASIPTDLAHAIMDHTVRLYEMRGDTEAGKPGLSPAAARIAARYRRVAL